ncbi:alkaline phosphatase [Spizellomyces sp. 'palustris']|nr:alkaline phosphatase [Spizellomyces sp. 'palustris']
MADSGRQPLLGFNRRNDEESNISNDKDRRRKIIFGVFGVSLILLIGFTLAATIYTQNGSRNSSGKRNVILMISDGFGPASETLARNYYQYTNNLPIGTQLPLDTILVGSSRTRSSNSLVTDSAAGATAFACGLKTYNGAIAVDPESKPCGTVLEAAKEQGYLTGLVVTSRITHATPACFAAHVGSRASENDIALQEIGNYALGRRVDLMFGGGNCQFRPNSDPKSCRADGLDVFSMAKNAGWSVLDDHQHFQSLKASEARLPLMSLLALDHMPYEIDRDPQNVPSLKEMAVKALDILTHASDKDAKGFFLMIEGSRIDMAGHNNDPATHVREILAYNEVIAAVKAYVDKHPDTVMISVSDHETGGLSVGRQVDPRKYPDYAWKPNALTGVKKSTEAIAPAILAKENDASFITETVLKNWMNVTDATTDEIETLTKTISVGDLTNALGEILSKRAQLGWATHGHSAVDVNLYAYGLNAAELAGNHENTEISDFIVRQLGLNLEAITIKLRSQNIGQASVRHETGPLKIRHYHTD